ncbi:cytochrome c5 family protein [Pigmentiphaga aceris]|uniref:Cytochrome c5 family protein n=1 Tax=Pigmentiphaga aceris TaxID=1940612 RepID=A0A5C0B1D5_9BURK|nr:c-type cytochrome [Pigmentiphaga aceris]QEI06447.1 cytochrome c5 family protein [Pigmentiphaga aceris]
MNFSKAVFRWLGVVSVLALALLSAPTLAADAVKPGRSGQAIYSVSCVSCHGFGMRGAPKVSDSAAWAPRLAQGKDKMYQHVIDGMGWMPRRGTCFTCSDDEVKAAVDYMVSQVK